jgi:putative nucleotidyltransferase with HDIG domain
MLALLGLTIALANMEIELPFAVSLSFIFASVFAGVLYAGPTGGGLLGMAGAVSIQEIRDRKSPVLLLGNLSQLFLAGLGAGWAFVLLGGIPVQLGGSLPRTLEGGLLAPAVAVVVFFVLNLVLVGVAVVLRNGVGIREAVRILNPSSYWISLLVLALLGYVMVQLIALASWVGLLLLVLPFTMARRTFRVYVELSEAFTETVRSLVTAIEAKDPYTRGHSERVAVYSRRLGEDAGLMTAELEVLERAALLHDVGKIGISLSTLTSSEQLTAEEVREIRQHPVLGAELVEDVEFLSALVPIIRHHHERFDGAGYPDGLAGEQIPVLSRILAAADCYDAMTSDRAYRPRLSGEAALLEMERVAGSQLDADCVERLANLVREEPGVAS